MQSSISVPCRVEENQTIYAQLLKYLRLKVENIKERETENDWLKILQKL